MVAIVGHKFVAPNGSFFFYIVWVRIVNSFNLNFVLQSILLADAFDQAKFRTY